MRKFSHLGSYILLTYGLFLIFNEGLQEDSFILSSSVVSYSYLHKPKISQPVCHE